MMTNLLRSSFLLFIFTLPVEAETLKELKVLSDSIPYEVELMLDHLKESELNSEQTTETVATLTILNDDLSALDKKNLMFLFKSEVYKGILTNQYLKLNDKLQLSTSIIDTITKKLEKNKIIYTKFSTWTVQSILNDLSPYMENNFINRYQNINRSNSKEILLAKKLQKVFRYISPLLSAFINKSPEEFNGLQKDIILDTFKRISLKSYYYKELYIKDQKGEPLFKIPQISLSPVESILLTQGGETLDEESSSKKAQALEDVKSLDKEDMSSASDSVDQINDLKE